MHRRHVLRAVHGLPALGRQVDDWLPLETAVLVGCGVPTGWATANYAGGVRAGDTTVVYGIGGIGINAVQGAAAAGAKNVIAVDPLAFKRETALKLGATHAFASADEAAATVAELTWGQMADQALVTDIVKLLRLYDAGQLKLDELVPTRYTLDQVNAGYQDLRDGNNIRGVIVYDTP